MRDAGDAVVVDVNAGVLRITDNDGLADGVTVSVSVTDYVVSGNRPVTVGSGCQAPEPLFPDVTKCPKAGVIVMTVSLGAGHDEFNTSDDIAVPVTVQGGDGDDRLLGASTQADDLDGGAGNDVVTLDAPGTAGDDLSGGDGRDSMTSAPTTPPRSRSTISQATVPTDEPTTSTATSRSSMAASGPT